MSYVLLFDSEKHARLIKTKVSDGSVVIEGKQFFVDTSQPLLLKRMFGYVPLYIIKWNDVEPARNIHLERVNPKFEEKGVTPELLRKLMGLKILGNMIKTKAPPSGMLYIIIGLIAGMGILYSLILLRVLPM